MDSQDDLPPGWERGEATARIRFSDGTVVDGKAPYVKGPIPGYERPRAFRIRMAVANTRQALSNAYLRARELKIVAVVKLEKRAASLRRKRTEKVGDAAERVRLRLPGERSATGPAVAPRGRFVSGFSIALPAARPSFGIRAGVVVGWLELG